MMATSKIARKTQKHNAVVTTFLDRITAPVIGEDGHTIAAIMEMATTAPPRTWNAAIVGFGDDQYLGQHIKTAKANVWEPGLGS